MTQQAAAEYLSSIYSRYDWEWGGMGSLAYEYSTVEFTYGAVIVDSHTFENLLSILRPINSASKHSNSPRGLYLVLLSIYSITNIPHVACKHRTCRILVRPIGVYRGIQFSINVTILPYGEFHCLTVSSVRYIHRLESQRSPGVACCVLQ